MNKVEYFAFVTYPFIFGLVLIFIGIYGINQKPELTHGIIVLCSGFICVCFFGANSILAKILENKSG